MNKEEYQKIVNNHIPKTNKLKNSLISFLVGGLVGVLGVLINEILEKSFQIPSNDSVIWTIIVLISLSSIMTSLGFFDEFMSKTKCGLLIPITGFSHSVTSASMEYKKEGLITGIGSNILKLAGSVIVYGIISAFLLTIIKVIFL